MYRTITAETTDEQILAPIAAAKQALVDFATEQLTSSYMEGDRLVGLAQNVRTLEAVAHAQLRFRDLLASDFRSDKAMYFLLETAVRTEDRSSGRDNDSIRACQDAVRGWASDAARDLRYGV